MVDDVSIWIVAVHVLEDMRC